VARKGLDERKGKVEIWAVDATRWRLLSFHFQI